MSQAKRPSTLDPKSIPPRTGTVYPPRYAGEVKGREKRPLGDAFGLTQFGVNLTTLPPGCWSSHRHWHESEDELVYVLSGDLVLVDDDGGHPVKAGVCVAWPAGAGKGHHLINRSAEPAILLEIGTRASDDRVHYSDADMQIIKESGGPWQMRRKDGTPY